MRRQAPGELGKMQWDAAAALSAIDELPADFALAQERAALSSIMDRIDTLNDRYYPVTSAGVERAPRKACSIVALDVAQAVHRDFGTPPDTTGTATVHSLFDARLDRIFGRR